MDRRLSCRQLPINIIHRTAAWHESRDSGLGPSPGPARDISTYPGRKCLKFNKKDTTLLLIEFGVPAREHHTPHPTPHTPPPDQKKFTIEDFSPTCYFSSRPGIELECSHHPSPGPSRSHHTYSPDTKNHEPRLLSDVFLPGVDCVGVLHRGQSPGPRPELATLEIGDL